MKLIAAVLLFAGAMNAQFLTPRAPDFFGAPNNSYPRFVDSSPLGETATVGGCVTIYSSNGTERPGIGYDITLGGWWTKASGWHAHESSGVNRPNPTLLGNDSATKQSALPYGCAFWPVYMPPISGWWTFRFLAPGTAVPDNGFNTYLGLPRLYNFEGLGDQYVTSDLTLTLVTTDLDHTGHIDFFDSATNSRVYNAMLAYYNATADVATLVRGSLPNGGMLDSQIWGSFWHPLANEEHYVGNEADIINPHLEVDSWFFTLVDKMELQGCALGKNRQGGGAITGNIQAYWSSQTYVHFVCSSLRLPRPPGHA